MNDIPVLVNAIASQTTTEGQVFAYTFSENTFSDNDLNEVLTYTATLENGNPLPSWLNFNAATRTFNGIPTADSAGTLNLVVTATDTAQASVSNTFSLTILENQLLDNSPTVNQPLSNLTVNEDAANTIIDLSNIFSDIDGDAIAKTIFANSNADLVTATIVDNQLTLDYLDNQSGTANITVRGTAKSQFVDNIFTITVNSVNDAPILGSAIANQSAIENSIFNFRIPANTFSDVDAGDTLTYSATLENGSPLPTWLTFDAANRIFSGTPSNANVGTLNIKVIATDNSGASVNDIFSVIVQATTLVLNGTSGSGSLIGNNSNNIITGFEGADTLTGNGGQDTFVFHVGDGNDPITDFAGTGRGSNPSATVIHKLDTLQFIGSGLTARNLQLTQKGNNLEVTFENVANTKVTLQNFLLENLDNLSATSSRPAIGNILLDGQTSITDSFDVIDANSTPTSIFTKNTVTFLNDLNNNITGFDNSNDLINGQGGNDIINGLSGNDLLRGGTGNDTLNGGAGNDILVGGAGADRFLYNTNAVFNGSAIGVDTISDFNSSEGDKIVLDKTTFSAITSTPGTGFSNVGNFKITSNAGTSTAKIVYDSVSGQLFYNQNGSAAGFGSGGLFATLTGAPTLVASDFVLQA